MQLDSLTNSKSNDHLIGNHHFNNLIEVIESCSGCYSLIYWHDDETLIDSYSAIQREAFELSKGLSPKTNGERIGLIAEMNREFIIRFFACQYAGIAPAILPIPNLNLQEWYTNIEYMLNEAKCPTLWLGSNFKKENFPTNIRCKIINDQTVLSQIKNKQANGEKTENDSGKFPVNDTAYIQFTSGTSGAPKGICITHEALMTNIRETQLEGLSLTRADKCISWLPFYHDMGLVGFGLAPFFVKSEQHHLSTKSFMRNPLRWLTLISDYQLTLTFAPNFAYEQLGKIDPTKIPETLNLSTWRVAGIGAEKIYPTVLERFFETYKDYGFNLDAFYPSYGMAEAVLAICIRNPKDALFKPDSPDISCGEILPNLATKIADDGEILIKGITVATHYANGELVPKTDDGYYRTGDIGFFKGRELYITGRKKECIIINGRNIWPEHVEQALENIIPITISYLVTPLTFEGKETIGVVLAKQDWDQDEMKKINEDCMNQIFELTGASSQCFFITEQHLLKTSLGKLSRLATAKSIQNREISFVTL